MSSEVFKYLLTFLFVAATMWLSYIGMKKTKCLKGFSVGNRDMSPVLVGITMAASIASTATFVINPGFVYTHGLSAYLHYGVAALFGVITAFVLLTKGFRQIGETTGSITIPDWIFNRYKSRSFSLFFAGINLLSITFVVLILVGCSLIMSHLFPISQKVALISTLLFVFSYVLMGGTYAHAYTNTLQGLMMLFISAFLFLHGLKYFNGGFIQSLLSVSTDWASVYNKSSTLYYDFFSVFLSSFIITFALMLQPHILTKVLYLKSDKDIKKFLMTTFIVGGIFGLILFVGFYAKLAGLNVSQQDAVVTKYIFHEFSGSTWGPYFLVFLSLTLLAAGMSTLDGILVALSSMVVNDIYLPISKQQDHQKALMVSRWVLIVIGLLSLAIAWNPPQLVGLFAQKGVYAIAAASLSPILFGVLVQKPLPTRIMFLSSLIGFFAHLILNIYGGITNPSVSGSYAITLSVLPPLFYLFGRKKNTLHNI